MTLGEENAKEMLHQLVYEGTLSYNKSDLKSKFNKNQFFQKEFYSISLFYLGLTTIRDDYKMRLPNNTIRTIFIDYYNTLNKIDRAGYPDKTMIYNIPAGDDILLWRIPESEIQANPALTEEDNNPSGAQPTPVQDIN